jgi:hypothetical protein
MSHVLKSENSVFVTGGSIIKVKDTITVSKQPINIGLQNPQFIEFDILTKRYYIANGNIIKVYDDSFNLITTITEITGIVSMQLDTANNRLVVTDRNTPGFWTVNLSTNTVASLFSPSGITEAVKVGYYDASTSQFYIGTNKIYIYSNTGTLTGMITDSRMQASTIVNLIINPYSASLLISIPGKILIADTSSMLVQANSITGIGVDSPSFIRFDSINQNSYWLCNAASTYITEMNVATNSAVRILALGESTPYSIWIEKRLGLYSILIADAGYNQFYKLTEKLV